MKTYQEKAEAYVRQQLPELMKLSFGCRIHDNSEPLDWAKAQIVVHYDFGKSVLVAREPDGSTYRKSTKLEGYEIIGHPIQLQHWLTAINLPPNSKIENYTDNRFGVWTGKVRVFFDRKSGQPATEADYQAFCEIVGVE